jgi:hypothetical protein
MATDMPGEVYHQDRPKIGLVAGFLSSRAVWRDRKKSENGVSGLFTEHSGTVH